MPAFARREHDCRNVMLSTMQPGHDIESARHATAARLIAADKVEGTAVYNPQGAQLGQSKRSCSTSPVGKPPMRCC